MSTDYALRAAVLQTDLVKTYKDIKQNQFYNSQNSEYYDYELLFLQSQNKIYFDEAVRIAKADFSRNTRLKHRVARFLELGDCVFVTLTFRDDVLENTSPETRRKYVTRFLKSCGKYYVGNIDFGEQNGREHYHAIIVTVHVNMDNWIYGYIFCEKVLKSSKPLILAKYISKLANHAVKSTTKRCSLIYSRVPIDERMADLPYNWVRS